MALLVNKVGSRVLSPVKKKKKAKEGQEGSGWGRGRESRKRGGGGRAKHMCSSREDPLSSAARCVVERDPERQCAWLPVHHNGFTPWLREAGGCQQSSYTCTSTSSQPPHPPPSLPPGSLRLSVGVTELERLGGWSPVAGRPRSGCDDKVSRLSSGRLKEGRLLVG